MKTKVIAFRVTEQEYNAIALAATERQKKVGDFVRDQLWLEHLVNELQAATKRLEAKAKRAAKKAATIEAANAPE